MVAENAVDPHHFRFVHRTPISPVVLAEVVEGPRWWARVGFGRRWAEAVKAYRGEPVADTDSQNTIEILWQGVGVSVNTEHMREGLRVIAINTTPVADGCTEMFATYWIDRREGDLEDGSFQRRLDEAKAREPEIVEAIKRAGYRHAVIDDEPFRSGRLNAALVRPAASR